MKVPFAIIALMAITWLPHVIPQNRRDYITYRNNQPRATRQSNAEQMVQNILQWLQGAHTDSSRRTRQDALRAYLPPITNTQNPRPFEPAPPDDNTIIGLPPREPTIQPEIPLQPIPGEYEQPHSPYQPPEEAAPGPNEIIGPSGEPSHYPQEPRPGETTGPPRETPTGVFEYPGISEEPGSRITTSPPDTYSGPPQEPGYNNPEYPAPGETPSPPQSPGFEVPARHGTPPPVTGYPPSGETPQPPFPPVSPPFVPQEPVPPEATGYPPSGETPQPPFPPIGPPSVSEESVPPEATDYPPSGKTPQPPFPPIGPPSVPEEPVSPESTSYPPSGETLPPIFPPVSSPSVPQEPAIPEGTGYPPSGETPQPPFPPIGPPSVPQEPVPPESTSYPPSGETLPPIFPPVSSPSVPQESAIPEGTGYPPSGEIPQPPFPPIGPPAVPQEPVPPESTGYPPSVDTPLPSFPPPSTEEEPFPPSESPIPSQPPAPHEVTGYPPSGETPQIPFQPETTPIVPVESGGTTPKLPETQPEQENPLVPEQPGQTTVSTFPPLVRETISPEVPSRSGTETTSPIEPSSPPEEERPNLAENPEQPTLPEVNSSKPPTAETQPQEPEETSQPLLPEVNPSEPSATKQTESRPTESQTPSLPVETTSEPGPPTEDDLKHPPHVHAIDVDCAKDMMTINIEFDRQFDGVIYSKGFYNNPDCRYVGVNSGKTKYTFTVRLDSCGTEFVNAFETQNQSYLENVLVLQNEVGIQEVWDTIRSVRCLWEGSLSKSLTVSLSVGMLKEEIVTFSGDTAVARLDIQLGEGPFAPSANGLVPIGEKMTLVISVTGDPGFDIQVKECKAKDTSGDLEYALTDQNGCVLRSKLFGAFQKTRNTGNTDASIIAYAFFNAFKFPDLMDLMIECNVELCKTDCDVCPDPNQKIEPGKRRRRDLYNETIGEPVKIGKLLRVILPQDLSDGEKIIQIKNEEETICIPISRFVISFVVLISLTVCSIICSAYMFLKYRRNYYKQQF